MNDKKASPASRLRAATCILKHANKFGLEDLEARVKDLKDTPDTSHGCSQPSNSASSVDGDETPWMTSPAAAKTERIVLALLGHAARKPKPGFSI
jgi:hypothetical protein